MRSTLTALRKTLAGGRKLSMLTCYDASFARTMAEAGVDAILIGDSLGMVVQGHDSTLPVTIDDIAYHTAAVARAAPQPWLVADMSFGSYQESPAQALRNAVKLMQAGAQMVKIEGGAEIADTIAFLTMHGIPVCGHIGLVPQRVHALGGYRVQGKDAAQAARLLDDARAFEQAGAAMLVIEAVPEPLARSLAESVDLITIGIGASVACDGQVLVMHDMLGLGAHPARFVKNFMREVDASAGDAIRQAFAAYARQVGEGSFPGPEQVYGGAAPADAPASYGGQAS